MAGVIPPLHFYDQIDGIFQEMDITLNNGYHLIVEQNTDPGYQNEIMVCITDNNNSVNQDLAIVRHLDNGNKFEVIVYADKDDKDYTDKFEIELYKEKE